MTGYSFLSTRLLAVLACSGPLASQLASSSCGDTTRLNKVCQYEARHRSVCLRYLPYTRAREMRALDAQHSTGICGTCETAVNARTPELDYLFYSWFYLWSNLARIRPNVKQNLGSTVIYNSTAINMMQRQRNGDGINMFIINMF